MAAAGDEVLRRLETAGYQAYYVGGCVRDELMGRAVHDMDIATSAQPGQVIDLFERTVPTGLAHGTVTVLLEGFSFEVTTFRRETGYADHRRPSEVEFVEGIGEDLKRRDFTMNAIARNLDGQLFDPYGGSRDIERGWIRCVGKPEERFEEDALRMLRAVRFASVFGFKPLPSLWRGLVQCRDGMSYIAVERIRSELERIVLGPRPLRGLELLRRSGLLERAKAPLPAGAGQDSPAALAALPALAPERPALRWSLLLQALGVSASDAETLLRTWTFPGVLTRQVVSVLQLDEAAARLLEPAQEGAAGASGSFSPSGPSSPSGGMDWRRSWIKLQLVCGREATALWLERETTLKSAGALRNPDRALLVERAQEWHRQVPVHQVSDLAVTAGEVMALSGRRGGPWLGELMKELLEQVASGDLSNEQPALLNAVKERFEHGI